MLPAGLSPMPSNPLLASPRCKVWDQQGLQIYQVINYLLQVCDFGLSRVRMSTLLSGKSQAGTPEWTAPEVLRSQAYDESSDCYS